MNEINIAQTPQARHQFGCAFISFRGAASIPAFMGRGFEMATKLVILKICGGVPSENVWGKSLRRRRLSFPR